MWIIFLHRIFATNQNIKIESNNLGAGTNGQVVSPLEEIHGDDQGSGYNLNPPKTSKISDYYKKDGQDLSESDTEQDKLKTATPIKYSAGGEYQLDKGAYDSPKRTAKKDGSGSGSPHSKSSSGHFGYSTPKDAKYQSTIFNSPEATIYDEKPKTLLKTKEEEDLKDIYLEFVFEQDFDFSHDEQGQQNFQNQMNLAGELLTDVKPEAIARIKMQARLEFKQKNIEYMLKAPRKPNENIFYVINDDKYEDTTPIKNNQNMSNEVKAIFDLAARLQQNALKNQGTTISKYPYGIRMVQADNSELIVALISYAKKTDDQKRQKIIDF